MVLGDVHFEVSTAVPVVDTTPTDAYRAFTAAPDSPASVHFPVSVVAEPYRDVAALPRVFDAGEMWSLFKDRETRVIVHTGWGLDAPMWAAELAPGLTSARVHCGPPLLREEQGRPRVASPLRYPLDQILLTYVLSRREGTILHAAGAMCGGRLWLLAGRSGAGKSTVSRLLLGREGIELFSDDRIIVRRMADALVGYGTPWPGDARLARARSAPLGGILFLKQSSDNVITPVAASGAVERLMPVTSIPWHEPGLFPDVLSFCGVIAKTLPCFEMSFRPDDEAADMLSAFLA